MLNKKSIQPILFGIFCLLNGILLADQYPVLISEIMYHPQHLDTEAENAGEEFIEIYNSGDQPVDLSGWRFSNGIDYNFPAVNLDAGAYLVIAADVSVFSSHYPEVTNVIGGWENRLGNSGERIELEDNTGRTIDDVRYADEGQWAVRELGPVDNNHRGWTWSDMHDGGGKSLELINPGLSNDFGANWAASEKTGGTPGKINSITEINSAPIFVDVDHYPVIPHSNESVRIVSELVDDHSAIKIVKLYFRKDGDPDFGIVEMKDDGLNTDVTADDNVYSGVIPSMPDQAIVEFYLEAEDDNGNIRTFPAPSWIDGVAEQVTNCLYQVDDSYSSIGIGRDPLYRIVMREEERAELIDVIGSGMEIDRDSNAEMNATFISADEEGLKVRYNTGVRVRGKGTRKRPPISLRVNFSNDRLWNGVSAINLNTKFTHLQVLGCAIFKDSGLPVAEAKAVKVHVNGVNLALAETIPERMYGKYAYVEVIDSDFADGHFPGDNGGNIYRCMRVDNEYADWRYEGADPQAYTDTYFKQTNMSDYDWTDLIQLTDVMNNTSDDQYVEVIRDVLDIDQWMHWFAIEVMMSNNETNPGSGQGDDYYMYRGQEDKRFILLPHDLDTIFGQGREKVAAYTLSIWAPTMMSAINRLITHPEFITMYYQYLKEVSETVFETNHFNTLIENTLGSWAEEEPVLAQEIELIKEFVENRKKFILTGGYPTITRPPQIPQFSFTATCNIQKVNNTYLTHRSILQEDMLSGTADVYETQSITINGRVVQWNPVDGTWEIGSGNDIPLTPGTNTFLVSAWSRTNGNGNRLDSETFEIDYEESTFEGTLQTDTTLQAELGHWRITSDIIVPANRTLTIEPGTDLIFEAGTGIIVRDGGCLIAEGSEYQQIGLLPDSIKGNRWNGITFEQTMADNRLVYVNMEDADQKDQMILVDNSRLLIDHMIWSATDKTIVEVEHPSLIIRHSSFPEISENEAIHGHGLTGNEYLIIAGNTFATTTGYNDLIDFSGCKRPGPILQLYDNTFLGGGDDGLDLDGCDAHIEGNVFVNFHKSHERESTSNAIATGMSNNQSTDITVVRNVFFNNDHAILLKEGSFLRAENNVFVNCSISAINFSEFPYRDVTPGLGACFDSNIFYDNTAEFENRFSQEGQADPQISVNRSIIGSDLHCLGEMNLDADPQFVDADGDFHLMASSPAIKKGINGLDMGAYVPEGASISGEPDSLTKETAAILNIDGPGIDAFKYCINDTSGVWSEIINIDSISQIHLSNLQDGQSYTLFARGLNSANVWQRNPRNSISKTWKVNISGSEVNQQESALLPGEFRLHQNVPNPFNAFTSIRFELSEDSRVRIQIYDLLGRNIRNLKDAQYQAGVHQVVWDSKTNQGEQAPTGIYFIHIRATRNSQTRKMLLLK